MIWWRVIYIVLLGLAGLRTAPFTQFGLYAGTRSDERRIREISLTFLLLYIVRDVFEFATIRSMAFLAVNLLTYAGSFGVGWYVRRWKLYATLIVTSAVAPLPLLLFAGWSYLFTKWSHSPHPYQLIFSALVNLMIFGGHELLSWLLDVPAAQVRAVGETAPYRSRVTLARWKDPFLGAILVHPAILLLAALYGFVFGADQPMPMHPNGASGPYSRGFQGMGNAMGTVVTMYIMSAGITVFMVSTVVGAILGLGIAIALRDR